MKDAGYQGFTGFGIEVDEKGNILFSQQNTYCKRTQWTAFCAAQMSICVFDWLRSHDGKTTVADLLKELDSTSI